MASAKKAVTTRMRYSQKHGKMVMVNPKRSMAIKKGKKKKRTMSAAHKAAIGRAVSKAFRTKKNMYGHKIRKWGRPSLGGPKKKEGTGKKRGSPAKTEAPKRSRPKKVEAPKRGRPAGSKNKPKEVAPKRGRPAGSKNKPKEVAPKRSRPRKKATAIQVAVMKKRGMRAA